MTPKRWSAIAAACFVLGIAFAAANVTLVAGGLIWLTVIFAVVAVVKGFRKGWRGA